MENWCSFEGNMNLVMIFSHLFHDFFILCNINVLFFSLCRRLAMQRQYITITPVALASSSKSTIKKMAWCMGKYGLYISNSC